MKRSKTEIQLEIKDMDNVYKKTTINIVMAVNKAFLKPLKVAFKSLVENSKNHFKLYLLNSSLTEKELNELTHFIEINCKSEFKVIDIDESLFVGFPLSSKQFTIESYYRIFIPYFLPKDMERCMWLDADTLILNDISCYYFQDLKGKSISACLDINNDKLMSHKKNLRLWNNNYFNSGVILYDLDKVRKGLSYTKIQNTMKEYSTELCYYDQDLLNILFYEDILYYDKSINYQLFDNFSNINDENIAILHFVGRIKPWNYKYVNKQKYMYWRYAKEVYGNLSYIKFLFLSGIYSTLKRFYLKLK